MEDGSKEEKEEEEEGGGLGGSSKFKFVVKLAALRGLTTAERRASSSSPVHLPVFSLMKCPGNLKN